MNSILARVLAAIGLTVITGCSTAPSAPQGSLAGDRAAAPQRTLVVAISREPASVADKTLRPTGSGIGPDTSRPFNAGLAIRDERDVPHPYLAQTLPELATDSWVVSPDGRMETAFRLRPSLTWHDGTPLTAADFVFGWRVYAVPEFGYADAAPIPEIDEVLAPDPQLVVIRWRRPYPGAAEMDGTEFPPLPRHILEAPFQSGDADAFVAHPYWGQSHVGLGPYRLEHWELGTFIEGGSFEGHVSGPPKIPRLKMVFMADANTVVASLLSGAVHTTDGRSIRFQQGRVLQQGWVASGAGNVILSPKEVRMTMVQFKPEFVKPTALLDLRVRRALAHAINRQGLVDGLLDGQGIPADTLVSPQVEYFPALDRILTKYPYDLSRSEQLMREAGFEKGPDGFYTGPGTGRFSLELSVSALAQNEAEAAVIVDALRRGGVDMTLQVLSQAQAADRQVRSSFSGISSTSHTNAFEPPVKFLRASEMPTPENRWRGSNRGGWNHPEFERVTAAFDTTLDRSERNQRSIDLLKVVSEEVPAFPLYYNLAVIPYAADLRGPLGGINWNWNLPEWEWVTPLGNDPFYSA